MFGGSAHRPGCAARARWLPTLARVARMSELLSVGAIAEDPGVYVRRHGMVIDEFGRHTQDSGNVSWLVDVGDQRLFVKTAGDDSPPQPGAGVPYLDHEGRVRLLRNAIELAASCRHPALPRLLNVIESPNGPVLLYEAAPGELVGVPRGSRDDPSSRTRGSRASRPISCSASSTSSLSCTWPSPRPVGSPATCTTVA
jgi:hypothetical protein